MEIREIFDENEKASIAEKVLNALPDWFGVPESTLDYISGVKDKPFYAVFSDNEAVGFVSVLVHSPYTAEIYVMGILETHHRMGIGRQLVTTCEEYCHKNGMEFLTVKTLDEKNPDEYYRKTRLFYESMGFKKIEVFPLLWDECNPCLFLAKYVTVMDIDLFARREKMLNLRDELSAVEEDRIAGRTGISPDDLEVYFDEIVNEAE